MKDKKSRLKSLLLSVVMMVCYSLPFNSRVVMADTMADTMGFISIEGQIKQSQSTLQPGDQFSLSFYVNATRSMQDEADKPLYISEAVAKGGGINSSKAIFSAKEESIGAPGKTLSTEVTISGLIYNGGDKEVEVTVYLGREFGDTTIAASENYTLSARTSDDMSGTLIVDKQEPLLVKTDQNQNVEVKITSKASFTINQADVKLSLDSKIEGVSIKSDRFTIKNIRPKENKKAQFSIAVDKDVKAGVYPATVNVMGNSYPVSIQVDSNIIPSALEVSLQNQAVFTPGVEKLATFKLNNIGDRDAKNIRIELVNTENVAVIENSNVSRINLLGAKSSKDITMKVRIDSDFKGESVALPIKLNYLSSTGEQAEDIQYIYLYTTSKKVASEVTITNIQSPDGTFDVNQDFNIKFTLYAKEDTDNIKVSVEGDEGIVPKSQSLFYIGKLAKGESKNYSVSLAAIRTAVSSSHPLKITVIYGEVGKETTINQYGSVNIFNSEKDKEENKEESQKSKPKVIIGAYRSNPTIVRAGQEFDLEIEFLNTSDEKKVRNFKANLTVKDEGEKNTGSVFTPVGASNTVYIKELLPNSTETKKIRLYTIPSAAAKTYDITLDMEYEDEQGENITATEHLGIPVEQVTKLEVAEVNIEQAEVGKEVELSATIYNTGKTDISNIRVKTVGEGFEVKDNALIIGSLEKGASKSYMPTITPLKVGTLEGKIQIQYEDVAGQIQNYEYDFQIEATASTDISDEGLDDIEIDKEEKDTKGYSALGIIVIVGIAAVSLLIIKKRKKRIMSEENEI